MPFRALFASQDASWFVSLGKSDIRHLLQRFTCDSGDHLLVLFLVQRLLIDFILAPA